MIRRLARTRAAADESAAARLIADAIDSETIPATDLWAALRPVLARLARSAAERELRACDALETGFAEIMRYSSELDAAAQTLERADARRAWARWREIRRGREHLWSYGSFGSNVRRGMLDAVRQFRGTR
ncbi:MAG TPA: hypothetical protein VJP45_00195 [Candidatus Limnocylindria bacterium]|nr:hypothetical protein [Candidatus Limnocylindria bacterium]